MMDALAAAMGKNAKLSLPLFQGQFFFMTGAIAITRKTASVVSDNLLLFHA